MLERCFALDPGFDWQPKLKQLRSSPLLEFMGIK
jgi:hypothetical protein